MTNQTIPLSREHLLLSRVEKQSTTYLLHQMKLTPAGKVQRLHGAPHEMLREQCMREGNELCNLTE